MKIKKLLCMVVSAAAIISLTGCADLEPAALQTSAPSAESSTEAPSGTENKTAEADTEGGGKVIAGFLFDGYIDDAGWNFEHNKGRLAVEEAGIKTIYKENVPQTQDCEKVMQDFINQGAAIIFGTSFGFMEYMDEMALKYPEVTFLHCGGYLNEDNYYNYQGRQYESRFLSGIIAASVSKTGKIGYVGGYEIAQVIRGINAFTLGAQLVNPDIEVQVAWTHTWDDAAVEKAAGQTLIDNGCDVLTCHETTSASLMPAEENPDVYAIGFTTDVSELLPTSYLTSSAFNWAAYCKPTAEAIAAGTWEKANYWGGLGDGTVYLTPYSEAVPREAADLAEEYKNKIIDGSYHIFEGPILGQDGSMMVEEGQILTDEELNNMMYFVKGVTGSIEQ